MASWGPLGSLLERSWALFGPSWGPLGPLSLEPFGGHLEASRAHRKRKGEKVKNNWAILNGPKREQHMISMQDLR